MCVFSFLRRDGGERVEGMELIVPVDEFKSIVGKLEEEGKL